MGQNGQTATIGDRHDGAGKAVVRPGRRCPALGFHGQGIGHFAGKAVFGGDDIGRDTLRHKVGLHRQRRINRNCRPVAAHGNPAHHLDPASNVSRACAALYLIGG